MPRMKKYFRSMLCVLLSALILTGFGCSVSSGLKKVTVGAVKSNHGSSSYRIYNKNFYSKQLSGDDCALYFDEKSGGISFYNSFTSFGFNSLPDFKNSFAASFIVSIFDGENIHYLDTSLHCAENNGITFSKEDNTLFVNYQMKKEGISLSLPVEFRLSGTYLEVTADISASEISEGMTLLSIAFLPYLGAVSYESVGGDYSAFNDYYVLPDGVGAVMYTAVEDENKSSVFSVYSKEYYEESLPCALGAYGIKKGDNALAVCITDGSENALIKVFRANADEERINRVYPEFIITPVSSDRGEINIGGSFSGKIGVTYELLSDGSADYIGIATSVRQTLINKSLLSEETAENEYPLFVTVTGSVDGTKKEAVTSFGQAENLLSILKGKGINNINMILEGAFSDGIKTDSVSKIRPSSALGSRDDLNEFLSFAEAQKLRVFAGVNFLTAKNSLAAGKGISGEKREYVRKNELYPYVGDENIVTCYLGTGALSACTGNVVSLVSRLPFAGVCLLDSDKALHEDTALSGNFYKGYSEVLNTDISAISSKTSVMLKGSSFNIIKNAAYLDGVSLSLNGENTGSYTEIPFIPAVLHGSIIYSSKAANTEAFTRIQLLKSVEYGAAVSFLWNFSADSDKYYENTLNEAVDFYLKAEKDFSSLSSKRITGHSLYKDGVYCTEFEGGVKIYVNYNNYSVIIGEVAVMPYDYLRIG